MINVGIVGMGVIGRHVADAITKGIPGVVLAGVTVRDPVHGPSATAPSHSRRWSGHRI
jgi:Glyceraldehyde-3-phosphate dehydrogenase/erythrose-4-phosphate dehydrogenase